MNNAAARAIFRWVHVLCGVPIVGYVYSPPADAAEYAPLVRFVFLPVIVLSGLWLWKGHAVRRLFARPRA